MSTRVKTEVTVVPNIQRTQSTLVQATGFYMVENHFNSPKLRVRSIVFLAKKLKPYTSMNVFIGGLNVNSHFTGCTVVQISTSGAFVRADAPDVLNDNIALRTVGTHSYDIINRGEVITAAGGSAVVVGDETIYDRISNTNKRVLYVANVIGTLSGTITGKTSGTTASVVSVTNGNIITNSLGKLYGVLTIPANSIEGGLHNVLITDSSTPNTADATTMADASFQSNGQINTFTTHNTYSKQLVTKIVDRTTTTTTDWYDTWYAGRNDSDEGT